MKLRDVSEQLQKLLIDKSISPNVCGICNETIPELGEIRDDKPTQGGTKMGGSGVNTDGDSEDEEANIGPVDASSCTNTGRTKGTHARREAEMSSSAHDDDDDDDDDYYHHDDDDDDDDDDVLCIDTVLPKPDKSSHEDANETSNTVTKLPSKQSKRKRVNHNDHSTINHDLSTINHDDLSIINHSDLLANGDKDLPHPKRAKVASKSNETSNPDDESQPSKSRSKKGKQSLDRTTGINPKLLKLMAPFENPKRPFKCRLCDEPPFVFLHLFQKHVRKHTGKQPMKRPYQCDKCNRDFSIVSYLEEHKSKLHSKSKSLKCSHSDCEFTTHLASHLQRHLQTHSGALHGCNMCGLGFMTKYNLRQHHKTTHQGFACPRCKKYFTHQHLLEEHLRSHKDRYRCDSCNFTCKTLSALEEHIVENHQKKRVYLCGKCKRAFKVKRLVQGHVKKCYQIAQETRGDDYLVTANIDIMKSDITTQCLDPRIMKMMATKPSLLIHQKPFRCRYCVSVAFLTPSTLVNHMRNVHPDNKDTCVIKYPYKCNRCGDTFVRATQVTEHLPCDGTFPCSDPSCEKTFTSKKDCQLHERGHRKPDKPHQSCMCSICGKSFSNPNRVKSHEELVHYRIRKYNCNHCSERFGTSRQRRKHAEQQHGISFPKPAVTHLYPCMCEHCGRMFANQNSLAKHLPLHKLVAQYCQYCTYTTLRPDHLKKHYLQVHHSGKTGVNRCNYCGLDYARRSSLGWHKKVKHPKPPAPEVTSLPMQGPPRLLAAIQKTVPATIGTPAHTVTTSIVLMEYPHHFKYY